MTKKIILAITLTAAITSCAVPITNNTDNSEKNYSVKYSEKESIYIAEQADIASSEDSLDDAKNIESESVKPEENEIKMSEAILSDSTEKDSKKAQNPQPIDDFYIIDPDLVIPATSSATNITSTSFTANWNTTPRATSGYVVTVKAGANVVKTINVSGQLSNSTVVTGLNPNTVYTYTVQARNGYMYSYSSNATSVSTISAILNISTFVGNGTSGYVDGTGTNARFNNPNYIDFDSLGNLYVTDQVNQRIRKITPSGVVSTFAGNSTFGFANGLGTAAQFYDPQGITVDPSDNVYVVDSSGNRIRKITPAGMVTTIAGSNTGVAGYAEGTGSAALFSQPIGITSDSLGNVYVSDQINHRIRKITPSGVVTTFAGNGTSGSTDGTGNDVRFFYPRGLATDNQNNIYVADNFSQKIRKITPSGVVSTVAGSGAVGHDDGTAASATFNYPSALTVDSAGNIYVSDRSNHLIRKISTNGIVSTLAGNLTSGYTNGPASSAQFYYPQGLALDASENLYICDFSNNTIRKAQ